MGFDINELRQYKEKVIQDKNASDTREQERRKNADSEINEALKMSKANMLNNLKGDSGTAAIKEFIQNKIKENPADHYEWCVEIELVIRESEADRQKMYLEVFFDIYKIHISGAYIRTDADTEYTHSSDIARNKDLIIREFCNIATEIIDCIVENYRPIRIINGDGAEVIDYSKGTTVKEPTLSLRYVGKAILDLTEGE